MVLINPQSTSIGKAFNNWTISVSKDFESAKNFKVAQSGTASDYGDKFVELTLSYIGEYDKNGDGVISYDEFKKKETEIALENDADAPDEATLKRAFDRLNVEQTGQYGDKLSQKEIFSYFIAMDSLQKADGTITKEEYAMMAMSLQDESKDAKDPGGMVKDYLKKMYNTIFGNE